MPPNDPTVPPVWQYPGYIVYQQLLDTRTWWTKELVDEFLTPDLIEPNPHNNSQTMRLYLLEQVREVESSDYFKDRCLEVNETKISPSAFREAKHRLERERNKRFKAQRLQRKRTLKNQVPKVDILLRGLEEALNEQPAGSHLEVSHERP